MRVSATKPRAMTHCGARDRTSPVPADTPVAHGRVVPRAHVILNRSAIERGHTGLGPSRKRVRSPPTISRKHIKISRVVINAGASDALVLAILCKCDARHLGIAAVKR